MENYKLEETVKKSNLNAKSKFDYEKLIYPMNYLLPCTYQEELEEIIFSYDLTGMKAVTQIKDEAKEKQYQFLINFSKLYSLSRDYVIPLTPDNIYYDENYQPHIKRRDIYQKGQSGKREDFIFYYKTYIGGLLCRKFTVKQLQESGTSVANNDVVFKEFSEVTDLGVIADILRKRKQLYLERQEAETVRVKKGQNRVVTILAIASSVLLLACGGFLAYQMLQVKPVTDSVLAANEAYVANDYVTCIDSLKEIEVDQMKVATKYILATAYAKSESLRKEEIADIVSKLSLSSNEKELEYWIYLGRLDIEKSEDIAKALSDDKLLMYAYMKELNQLETDTSIAGEKKASRISTLEENIKKLGDKYASVEETEEDEKVEMKEEE